MTRKFLLSQAAVLFFLFALVIAPQVAGQAVAAQNPVQYPSPKLLLLQYPTMSKTRIAFEYGGEIWIANRNGGTAHRLVTGSDILGDPIFSPDGSMIAYTGIYDHNMDVYVV